MRLDILHKLRYRYTSASFLEPMTVRLRPRCDAAQHLHHFQLTIDPEPAGRVDALDSHGNVVTTAWFNGQHEHLHLTVNATVETHRDNPFDYLITEPGASALPVSYAAPSDVVLAPLREPAHHDAAAIELAQALRDEAQGDTQQFLIAAMRRVHTMCEWIERHTGEPQTPEATLRRGAGACRDLAVLFINLCRHMGLAARFVSGYQYQPEGEDVPQLHAWAEVYLPGAGWRGYDPSAGLATATQHVAVAAGRTHEEAAPTQGTFRRTGAQSHLEFEVEIRESADKAS